MEQYEALRAKDAEQGAELEDARAASKAAIAAFNDRSRERLDTFNAAFDHVAAQIDPIFKVRRGAALCTAVAVMSPQRLMC